jgi:hypothetical protein
VCVIVGGPASHPVGIRISQPTELTENSSLSSSYLPRPGAGDHENPLASGVLQFLHCTAQGEGLWRHSRVVVTVFDGNPLLFIIPLASASAWRRVCRL